jgi:8-amino-7-oxononanoate synthase
MPPAIAAGVEKALELMHREPERVAKLQANSRYFQSYAQERGLGTGLASSSAIIPIVVGDSIATVLLSQELFNLGINVQPVLYPAVPVKSSRLRFFITAMHSRADIESAIDATANEMKRLPERLRMMKVPI